MIKVLLVDDERQILEGLKVLIDWQGLGYEIVGEAANGEQGISLAEKYNPDVIITDIRMPVVDGIKLIGKLASKMPDTKFLILSGYRDFEYARQGMNNGAYGYILKPVDEEILIDFLCKIKEEFEVSNRQEEEKVNLKEKLKESIPILKEKYLIDILKGNIQDEDEIKKKLEFIHININFNQSCVLMIEIDELDSAYIVDVEEINFIRNKIVKIIEDLSGISFKCISLSCDIDKILVIAFDIPQHNTSRTMIDKLMYEIRLRVQDKFDRTITIGVGNIYKDLKGIKNSYKESIKALEYKLSYGKNTSIYFEDSNDATNVVYVKNKELENDIILSVETVDKEAIVKNVDILFKENFCSTNLEPAIIYNECIYILSQVLKIENLIGMDIIRLDEVSNNKTTDKLKKWMCDSLIMLSDMINKKRISSVRSKVEDIKAYINNHYEESISLNLLASKFYMSPFYMSQLFKKETGENFVDFITKVRINNSKKLLIYSDLRIYEISERVGYKNPRYFSQTFEKIEGVTPSEYRESKKVKKLL